MYTHTYSLGYIDSVHADACTYAHSKHSNKPPINNIDEHVLHTHACRHAHTHIYTHTHTHTHTRKETLDEAAV